MDDKTVVELYLLRRTSSKLGTAAVVPNRVALEMVVSFTALKINKFNKSMKILVDM